MLGRSALLAATNALDYGNWLGNYSDVSLLLRNGIEGFSLADESQTQKSLTVYGGAQALYLPSFLRPPTGSTGVAAFNGTGDYITAAQDTSFELGTENFTIEAWVWLQSLSTQNFVNYGAFSSTASVSNIGWLLNYGSTREIGFVMCLGSVAYSATNSAIIAPQTWYHIAAVRNAGVITVYVNGIGGTGLNYAGNHNNPAGRYLSIGRYFASAPQAVNGYIDDLRITKGVARYTSNFTPPTAQLPANITDDPSYNSVSLLLRNGSSSEALVPFDESPTPTQKAVSVNGNASVTTAVAKWNEGSGGSSLAFDGSGDYFSTPKNPDFEFGSGDFTIECWVRLNVTNVDQAFTYYGAGIGGSITGWSIEHLTTGFRFYFYTESTIVQRTHPVVASANLWYHVAAVRNGSSLILYVDGVPSATTTTTASINAPTGALLTVGSFWTTLRFLNGYLDDLRITKGVARYTSNFTPPPAELPNF